ncbi:MAG: glycosyltransferase family 2 protein [Acidobacteria bacterium]|nr:glycosyltransferase family 2 protein [Acidobacteriota bacterium]
MAEVAQDARAGAAPKLTVIIGCFNYARYLPAAIDSVLAEDVGAQVIVVDDCSTDNSREVMLSYGDRITPIFQPVNQGVGAGFNAGFAQATGDLIYFLDADDFVLPGGLKRALANYEPGVLIYHYRMRYADEAGTLAGIHPAMQVPLGNGDISRQLREQGRYNTNVTSGLIFARAGLEKVMPVNAQAYRISAEGYLVSAIPLYGATRSFDETLSAYRLHSAQNWKVQTDFGARARKGLNHDAHRYAAIRAHATHLGLPFADNLGDADLLHLNDRLISLSFAPDEHPVGGDSVAKVVRLALAVRMEGETGKQKVARRMWWAAMGALPGSARRQLLRWKMDPKSRPAWLAAAGRTARRRLGLVMG